LWNRYHQFLLLQPKICTMSRRIPSYLSHRDTKEGGRSQLNPNRTFCDRREGLETRTYSYTVNAGASIDNARPWTGRPSTPRALAGPLVGETYFWLFEGAFGSKASKLGPLFFLCVGGWLCATSQAASNEHCVWCKFLFLGQRRTSFFDTVLSVYYTSLLIWIPDFFATAIFFATTICFLFSSFSRWFHVFLR
jgi:hypothetical protein